MSLLARARAASRWLLASWRRVFGAALALLLIGLAGVILFAWLGVYNVAASTGHFHVVDLFLRFGMENSVRARAPDTTLPSREDDDMVRLGAGHFHGGCAYCHGSPGTPVSPVAASMLPPPPDLKDKVGLWSDGELFWIVRHGLKYAGMPGWPVLQREDEVWALVAFLRRLPVLDRAAYRALAMGEVADEPQTSEELATGRGTSDAVEACARCHGLKEAPPSRLVPTLHGQPEAMLADALRAYAAGERDSGVMQTAVSGLSERLISGLAAYYSGLPRPAPRSAPPSERAVLDRGAAIAQDGVPSRGIPACMSCHGPDALPNYPRLAGQPARYLEGRLQAWRSGPNERSATGAIMAPIARRLSPEQSADLAAFFASLPPAGERDGRAGR